MTWSGCLCRLDIDLGWVPQIDRHGNACMACAEARLDLRLRSSHLAPPPEFDGQQVLHVSHRRSGREAAPGHHEHRSANDRQTCACGASRESIDVKQARKRQRTKHEPPIPRASAAPRGRPPSAESQEHDRDGVNELIVRPHIEHHQALRLYPTVQDVRANAAQQHCSARRDGADKQKNSSHVDLPSCMLLRTMRGQRAVAHQLLNDRRQLLAGYRFTDARAAGNRVGR